MYGSQSVGSQIVEKYIIVMIAAIILERNSVVFVKQIPTLWSTSRRAPRGLKEIGKSMLNPKVLKMHKRGHNNSISAIDM